MAWQEAQPLPRTQLAAGTPPPLVATRPLAVSHGPSCRSPPLSGRDATPQTATTRQRSKGGANTSGEAPDPLSWGEIFRSPDDYLRPLRAALPGRWHFGAASQCCPGQRDGCGAIWAGTPAATGTC